jgi:uncharacterized protein YbaP (TraB family)
MTAALHMFNISCPQCGTRHTIPTTQAGRIGRCGCGHQIHVPALPVETDATATVVPHADATAGDCLGTVGPLRRHRSWLLWAVIGGVVTVVLLAALLVWRDPLAGSNPAAAPERWLVTERLPAAGRPFWRLKGDKGMGGYLLAALPLGSSNEQVEHGWHWAMGGADGLVVEIDVKEREREIGALFTEVKAPQPIDEIFTGDRLDRLRKIPQIQQFDWSTLRTRPAGLVNARLMDMLAMEGNNVFTNQGQVERLLDKAHDCKHPIIALSSLEERYSYMLGSSIEQARELDATALHSEEIPALCHALHAAWKAGTLNWDDPPSMLFRLEPMSDASRKARVQRLVEQICTILDTGRRPLIAIDAALVLGSDGVRQSLARRGYVCTEIGSDPLVEFPDAAGDVLTESTEAELQSEQVCAFIERSPKAIRKTRVAEGILRWLMGADREKIRAALVQHLPPFAADDATMLEILDLWDAPGTFVALAKAPEYKRHEISLKLICSAHEQDWSQVLPILLAGTKPEDRRRLALETGSMSAFTAILRWEGATESQLDWNFVGWLISGVIDRQPLSDERLRQVWAAVDKQALAKDEAGLLRCLKLISGDGIHLLGVSAGPRWEVEPQMWSMIGRERWKRWWESNAMDHTFLLAIARLDMVGASPKRSGDGRGAMAFEAMFIVGPDREVLLKPMRDTKRMWLFFLTMYNLAASAQERDRIVALMQEVDPGWKQAIIDDFIANPMIQGEWTQLFLGFAKRHPESLAAVLAASPSTMVGNSVSPSRQVMMCYEMGPGIIPVAKELAANQTANAVARQNAIILLQVFVQERPAGTEQQVKDIRDFLGTLHD